MDKSKSINGGQIMKFSDEDSDSEKDEQISSCNKFANDGSFLEMFKKLQNNTLQKIETPIDQNRVSKQNLETSEQFKDDKTGVS